MNVKHIQLEGMRILEGTHEQLEEVKCALEQHLNLSDYSDSVRPVVLNFTTVMRICLLVGLSDKAPRSKAKVETLQTSAGMQPLGSSFFTKSNIKDVFTSLIKMRYCDVDADWQNATFLSKVLYSEMMRGKQILMQEGGIDEWLHFSPLRGGKSLTDIPELNLYIGQYEDGMDAALDINSTAVANTQILVAGTTGSGKSNLLAVLINQIRMASADTYYPVNFLLFDYKGEFSDPSHADWLSLFATDSSAILNPMVKPLPFTPFKDFTGKPVNEIHMYSTTLSSAICAISSAKIGALMDNRLSEAIVNAYKEKGQKPITFQDVLEHYTMLMPEKKREGMDSVKIRVEPTGAQQHLCGTRPDRLDERLLHHQSRTIRERRHHGKGHRLFCDFKTQQHLRAIATASHKRGKGGAAPFHDYRRGPLHVGLREQASGAPDSRGQEQGHEHHPCHAKHGVVQKQAL